MNYLFKTGVYANSSNNLLNSLCFPLRILQLVVFSSVSSSRSIRNPPKNSDLNNPRPRESKGPGPLFNEILGILGGKCVDVKKAPERLLDNEETHLSGKGQVESSPLRAQGIRENAKEKSDDVRMGNSYDEGIEDVSAVVHEVTKIVRSGNFAIPMEKRLEKASGFSYNQDVVDKVLKRCFKVPDLALRFFNWVNFSKGFRHTTNTFNTMINVAGEAKDISLVEELSQKMKDHSCEWDAKTWTILVSRYGEAKLIGKALMVFEEMKRAGFEPDSIANGTMLRVLCNAGKADLALEFYKDMLCNEVALDIGLYERLLKCVATVGDSADVHFIGENMLRLSEIPESRVYGLMLKSFCIAGRIEESLELIRGMKNKNVELETGIFETLVKGLCRKDRISDAMDILEIMKRRNENNPNIYGILINAYIQRNEVSEAFNLLQDAKKLGNVSVATYTICMQHLFRKHEYQKGLDMYNEMLDVGIQLDHLAITAVAVAYVRNNCLSEACKVFESMRDKGIRPTHRSYIIFIKELCKASEAKEIVKVLKGMQICQLNSRDDVFREVLSYLKKKGELEKMNVIMEFWRGFTSNPIGKGELDIDRANQVVTAELKKNEISPERLSDCFPESNTRFNVNNDAQKVCKILSSSTKWCSMQEKLEQLQFQFTPDLVAVILQNSGPNIGTALKFFSWVGKQADYRHTEKSYHMAMKIAGQGKNFKEMRGVLFEMKRRGCLITSDTWTIMIQQYGRTGLTDIALANFKEMKLSGCKPSKSTYKSLLTSLCGKKGRKVDEAIQIYHEMVRAGFVPDKELIETYMLCLCEANKLSNARSCIKSLTRFGFSIPLSYSFYFRALCRAGKLEDALALMDEIGSHRNVLDQYTYGSLIHALLRRGRLEEALEKMKCMKQAGVNPTVHVYTALIIHFLKEKQVNRALETLEEMKEHACQPSIVTYSAMICGYVRLGRVDDAWTVFRRLKQDGPPPDFKCYSMFINCLSRIGKSEEAFKLIFEMIHDGIVPSTVNFRTVMYGLNREGKPNFAKAVQKSKLDLKSCRKLVSS